MKFNVLKRKIAFILYRYKFVWFFAYQINKIFFHWKEREQHRHFGKLNPSIKFYVLRSTDQVVGLMSHHFMGLSAICKCERENLVPIIDFLNYKTQYNVDFPINGTHNSWEYYFEQPCKYSLDEVYKSRNVIISGWKFYPPLPYNENYTDEELYNAMQKIPIKQYIMDIADKKIKTEGINNMIGILVRGTDYVKLRPIGHAIPPTAEQAAEKVEEFLKKYGDSRIFLATEDKNIYDYFTRRYGDLIYTSDGKVTCKKIILVKIISQENFLQRININSDLTIS